MEPAGAKRHGREPRRGELSGESESIEPQCGSKFSCPANPSELERRGREWSRREPSDMDVSPEGVSFLEKANQSNLDVDRNLVAQQTRVSWRGGGGNGAGGSRATWTSAPKG